jgi:hypothetical protein
MKTITYPFALRAQVPLSGRVTPAAKTPASPSRRRFLHSVAAALATLPVAAGSQTAEPSGIETLGLIDCQSHLFCPELVALMEQRQTKCSSPTTSWAPTDCFTRATIRGSIRI